MISGPEKDRRHFLGIIRADFLRIHLTIPKIKVKEKIPLPDFPNIIVDYQHLLNLENLGIKSFVPEGIKKKFNVMDLLNGIEDKEDRKSIINANDEGIDKMNSNKAQINKQKIDDTKYSKKNQTEVWEKIIACSFGFLFISTMLVIAILFPSPTNFQIFIFRVILSLAASGIGAFIPGFIDIEMKKKDLFLLRAGGAIALFFIIYQINPPSIMSE